MLIYYTSQSQWTGGWAHEVRTDTWTLETLTRMSKQADRPDCEYG